MKNIEHERQEKYIAEGFCKYYSKQFGTKCVIVAIEDAPDVHLRIDGSEIYIELAQYRETGARNNA